jgi:uncharacterized membrane protein
MIVTAVLLIIGGGLLVWAGWLGMTDRLALNSWAGIRTKTTMRSQETWEAAHHAGSAWIIAGGIVLAITGGAMMVVNDETAAAYVSLVGATVLAVLVIIGGWMGHQAAMKIQ